MDRECERERDLRFPFTSLLFKTSADGVLRPMNL